MLLVTIDPGPVLRLWRGGVAFVAIPLSLAAALALLVGLLCNARARLWA
jgi:hypothetical protein